ncbi:protein of unknown function [Nitrospira japonica]|uniref:Uncharacterized protein n=1 Tax=Nitrospira japonica TaxID=1325564 RepID=A0A1W1I515_9BACT|nr:protein of unknown function [Nitrospira japonica]
MTIGIIYSYTPEVLAVVKRMDSCFEDLGHKVETNYKNGINPEAGWVLQVCAMLKKCDVVLRCIIMSTMSNRLIVGSGEVCVKS